MKRLTMLPQVILCAALAATASATLAAQNDAPANRRGQGGQPGAGGQGGGGGARRGGMTRGTVTSVSGANVLIKDETGTAWTVITTDNTRVMRGQGTVALSTVQPGDEVAAMGVPDADKHELHALMVMDVPAADAAKARANLGKTYITGRITAIHDTNLTILRPDRQSQTIALDETTSMRRGGRMDPAAIQAAGLDPTALGIGGNAAFGGGAGAGGRQRGNGAGAAPPDAAGESITLADIKEGDAVVALGGLKGGVFVPTDLRVQSPPPRRPPGDPAPPQ